jgi:hypothetical protein
MIRTIGRFLSIVIAIAALLAAAPPAKADSITYLSSSGTTNVPCTAGQPCSYLAAAFNNLNGSGGQVSCLDLPMIHDNSFNISVTVSVTIDCVGLFPTSFVNVGALVISAPNEVLTIRNLTISGRLGGYPAIKFTGSGNLILENCVFEDLAGGAALDIEPNGPLNLTIINSRISNNGSGVLLRPAAGGSIQATFDHVRITQNTGGGLKTDTTNGGVTVDIADSVISNNGGNGVNAVAGASQNIVSIKSSVIARNGAAGVQSNGANAGVLVATTLLDQNAAGAVSVVSGGNMFTYGNNDIVGAIGSGFTAMATLH